MEFLLSESQSPHGAEAVALSEYVGFADEIAKAVGVVRLREVEVGAALAVTSVHDEGRNIR